MTTNTPGGAVPTIIHNGHMIIGGLPEGARNINLNTPERLAYQVGANWSYIKLPPGTWQLIGLSAEITEEQKKEIVRRNDFREIDDHDMFEWFLKSHNLSENQTVILKLIEA